MRDCCAYLSIDLDFVADLDELHLLVEPEDVDSCARAAGVEDHGVLPWRRRQLGLPIYSGAGLPAKHRIGEGRAGVR